jgi:hypothetical protein
MNRLLETTSRSCSSLNVPATSPGIDHRDVGREFGTRGVSGGTVRRDQTARRLGLTWARVTQLLDLTLLAPNIQEQILLAEAVDGVEPVGERVLRQTTQDLSWEKQKASWKCVATYMLRVAAE